MCLFIHRNPGQGGGTLLCSPTRCYLRAKTRETFFNFSLFSRLTTVCIVPGIPNVMMAMTMKVYALHIMGLHLMIVGARCQEVLGECDAAEWGSTVITLYGCSVVRVSIAASMQVFFGLGCGRVRTVGCDAMQVVCTPSDIVLFPLHAQVAVTFSMP